MTLLRFRARVGWWLRCAADRLDPDGAPRAMGWSFTIEDGQGVVFNNTGQGCPLWYLGHADRERAYAEASTPQKRWLP